MCFLYKVFIYERLLTFQCHIINTHCDTLKGQLIVFLLFAPVYMRFLIVTQLFNGVIKAFPFSTALDVLLFTSGRS